MDNLVLEKTLKKAMMSVYKIIWSFTLGIMINNITKTNTVLKVPMGENYINIMENHSSFQYSLSIHNFIYLLLMTLTLNFIGRNKINKKFVSKIILYEFLLFLFLEGLNANSLNMEEIIKFIIALTIVLTIVFFYIYLIEDDEMPKNSNDKYLFSERKLDLERIEEALEISNVLGIDAEWGEGKTFIVDYLKVNKKNREIINLSILSLSEEDIFINIINQLDSILYKNKTFGFHSQKLKKIICNQSIFGLNFTTMFNNQSKKEAIEDYVKNFEILRKEVVIVFDDLDRIEGNEKIIKVFEFGELFKTKYIKIIYLFSQKQMIKLGYNHVYIEKFIPIIYKLTKLPFEKVLKLKFNESDEIKKYIKLEEFEFIIKIFKNRIFSYEEKEINYKELETFNDFIREENISIKYNLDEFSIRKIENFILELLVNLKTNEKLKLKIEKRIIIAYSFVRKFYDINFEKFFSLEEFFPIKLKYEKEEEKIIEKDLEEAYILKEFYKKNPKIDNINDIKILGKYFSVEYLLMLSKKFGVKIQNEEFTKEDTKEKLIVIEKYLKNIYIHSLFNYPTKYYYEDINLLNDRRNKINLCIKKLAYMGSSKLQSDYEFIYSKLTPILYEENLEKRVKNFYNLLNNNRKDIEYRSVNYDSNSHIPRMIVYFGKDVEELLFKYLEICFHEKEIYDAMISRINNEFILERSRLRKLIYEQLVKFKVGDHLTKTGIRMLLFKMIGYSSKEFGLEMQCLVMPDLDVEVLEKKYIYDMANLFLEYLKKDDINLFIREEIRLYYRFLSFVESIEKSIEIKEKSQVVEVESYVKFPEKIEKIINELLDLDITIVEEKLKIKLNSGEINVIELRTIFKEIKNNKK